jgi:tetratricopeptide (TPR) repeat protein
MSKLDKTKLLKRAFKLYKREEYEKSIKTANKILKSFPDELDVYILKGESLYNLGKHDQGIGCFKEYLKHSSKESKHFDIVIFKLIEINEYEEALNVLDLGLQLYPNNHNFITSKPKFSVILGRNDEAIEYVDKTSKTSPHWKDLLQFKAKFYKNDDNYDAALEVYNEILKYDSKDLIALSRKLKVLEGLVNFDEIDNILNEMIENNINKKWAFTTKVLYLIERDVSLAEEYINDILNDDPNYKYALFVKGKILYDLEKENRAIEYLNNGLGDEYEAYYGDLRYCLAEIYYERNLIPETINELSNIDPEDDYYEDALSFMRDISVNELKTQLNERKDSKNDFYPNINFKTIGSQSDVDIFKDTNNYSNIKTKEDYEKAIKSFEEDLGEEYIKENTGHFWGLYKTRPYMNFLFEYANFLLDSGEIDNGIVILKRMIVLNPNDNQGVRDLLITKLLEVNDLDGARKYLDKYKNDHFAFAVYNRLLLAIKSNEKETLIKSLFNKAIKMNKDVLHYLFNKDEIPYDLPTFYSPGDHNEAIYYVSIAFKIWDDDALNTLRKFI